MYYKQQQAKLKYEGNIFETKDGKQFIVTEYVNRDEVYVKFLTTGFETKTIASCVRKGEIKDPMSPTVLGVGVTGLCNIRENGNLIPEYVYWRSMLQRSYHEKSKDKRLSYKGCSVSDNFKYFPYFKEWCTKQVGFGIKGWCLDKDILIKGNKEYSPETCCFVPPKVNTLILNRKALRGDTPIGVHFNKTQNKYQANCQVNGKLAFLGYYKTVEEAFNAYKKAKEAYIKEVAEEWKDQIDPRVYEALINWTIEITD
jgi:hypothetical protein